MSMLPFHRQGIPAIVQGYSDGSWTPIDVAQWSIEAYQAMEPRCHAWECFDADLLLQRAREATERLRSGAAPRPLEGIPVGVKDIFNTIDFPTQMGSPLWRGFTPGNDARVLYDLKRNGAVLPGKTVTAEFAVHALGKTLNPHDAQVNPGTSSSGSAVAVAAGMVPVALGTQTAGSIVRPASFCGVWGCKPSFGLVPRTGMLKTTDSLDTVGYFVAHAADLQRVFDGIRVHGRDYPISHAALSDVRRQSRPDGRPWRVALVSPRAVWSFASDYAKEALAGFARRLAAAGGFEVVEAEVPAELHEAHDVHATIYNRALAYYFQEEFKRAELVSPVMQELIEAGQGITPAQYEQTLERQVQLARRMDAFFADFDIILTLSTAGMAQPRDEVEAMDSALIWTLAHLAVVSAPAFKSAAGKPFGLQIVARRYNDLLMFRFVEELIEKGLLPPGCNPLVPGPGD
jgi:Asp-tRNA(Asn)/Glu-tRNA(Gln) amidotransferase A subunit family amidase